MKKTLQKPIALFLAMIMAFGAMPFAGVAMLASAVTPELESISIQPGTIALTELDQTYELTLVPSWKNGYVGDFQAKDVTWRSSQPEFVSIDPNMDRPAATVRVEQLPKEIDSEMTIYIYAYYLNVLGVSKQAVATVKLIRTNAYSAYLKKITFDPSEVTLSKLNDYVDLKLNWMWTGSERFPLLTKYITISNSNEEYVVAEKLNPAVEGSAEYSEDDAVVRVKAAKLPANIGDSVFVTVTATYLNQYGVEKKAAVNIEVKRIDDKPVLAGITPVPNKVQLTAKGQSYTLDVLPVWENDKAGVFDKSNVRWSIVGGTNQYLKVDASSGVVTVQQLPSVSLGDQDILVMARYTDIQYDVWNYCTVTVKATTDSPTVDAISLSPKTATMKTVGETLQLYVVGNFGGSLQPISTGVAYHSSNEEYIKISSSGLATVVKTPSPDASNVTVTITAYYGSAFDTCLVTIPARKIYVDRMTGSQLSNVLVSNLSYSFNSLFKYQTYLTETPPAGVTVDQSTTLTCIPSDALVIDNVNKIIKVMPIVNETAVVKLVLTANNPGPNCKPLEFDMSIRRDVPLIGVYWDYKVGSTGKTLFNYYEKVNGINQIAEYYYQETVGYNTTYKFHTDPEWARTVCTIKVTSSDKRVLKVDEATHRLIPCGNGETRLTITATTPPTDAYPRGISKTDTIIVVVQGAPYTPITGVKIGYEEKSVAAGTTYDSSSNTISIPYSNGITLKGLVTPAEARLDQKDMFVTTSDGRKIQIVQAPEVTWRSKDTSIATINAKGEIKFAKPRKTTTIVLTVIDNGVEFTSEVNVKQTMSTIQIIIAIIICIITFRWGKIGDYLGR